MTTVSEMEYEKVPEVYTPWVRKWFPRAFDAVARFFYPPRRSFTIWWGWWMVIPALWDLFKVILFTVIIALLMGAQIVTSVWDMFTYGPRSRRDIAKATRGYAGEVFGNQSPRTEYPQEGAG